MAPIHPSVHIIVTAHTGWRSRGYLPHCDERGLVQHVVFGLFDALPEQAPPSLARASDRAAWADESLDLGHGSRLLATAANAQIVQASLLHDDGERYALAAWCVMPTHVHVLIEQLDGGELAAIVQAWKSASAHAINKRERRKGALWRREYFDRYMRTPDQFTTTVDYIENNPVAARLCAQSHDWRFSSACWRRCSD